MGFCFMRVLIACEFSGIVRDAFAAKGHDAWSCDLLPSERPGNHLQCDVLTVLEQGWDMMIAHPPCTYLAISGARWFKDRMVEQEAAIEFVQALWESRIPLVAIENPIGVLSTQWLKPSQIVQPWMFGHGETKATCLWLYHLPLLQPTEVVEGRTPKVHWMAPGPMRSRNRSRTYPGMAKAMADQWGETTFMRVRHLQPQIGIPYRETVVTLSSL